jgi:hypothetical protein
VSPEQESICFSIAKTRHLAGFVEIINDLNAGFKAEMALKHAQVEQIRGEVITATNELAEQRKQLSSAQTRLAEFEEIQQRIMNLERAVHAEESFDWNKALRSTTDQPTQEPATKSPEQELTLQQVGDGVGPDPTVPAPGSKSTEEMLAALRRIRQWQSQSQAVMQQRLQAIEGLSAEKAVQYSKVIALCVKIPPEKLDEVSVCGAAQAR